MGESEPRLVREVADRLNPREVRWAVFVALASVAVFGVGIRLAFPKLGAGESASRVVNCFAPATDEVKTCRAAIQANTNTCVAGQAPQWDGQRWTCSDVFHGRALVATPSGFYVDGRMSATNYPQSLLVDYSRAAYDVTAVRSP